MTQEPLRSSLNRRAFLKATAFALGGAALAACAPAAPAGQTDAGAGGQANAAPNELRLSAWADVQDATVYEAVLKAWQAQQSNFTATVEQYPGGYYEKIQANFAAGTPADVLYYQGWMWQPYAQDKVIVSLDDYIQKDGAAAQFPARGQGDIGPGARNQRGFRRWPDGSAAAGR